MIKTMMYNSIKILFLVTFLAAYGWITRTEHQDIKTDECCPYQANGGQCVDTCKCPYCQESPANDCDTLIADETWKVGEDTRNLVFTYNDEVRGILSKVGKTVEDFKDGDSHCTWYLLPDSINADKLLSQCHQDNG